MSWTATIVDVTPQGQSFIVLAVISDGTQKLGPFRFDPITSVEQFIAQAKASVNQDPVAKVEAGKLQVGATFDVTPDVLVVQPPPTDDELARAAFVVLYGTYVRLARGLAAGLPLDVTDAQTALVKAFDPSFVDLL